MRKAPAALVPLETPSGFVVLTRDQAKVLLRDRLAHLDLVGELLDERRAQAAADDAV